MGGRAACTLAMSVFFAVSFWGEAWGGRWTGCGRGEVSAARQGKARKRSIRDDRMRVYLNSRRLARPPHRARAYTDFWGSRRVSVRLGRGREHLRTYDSTGLGQEKSERWNGTKEGRYPRSRGETGHVTCNLRLAPRIYHWQTPSVFTSPSFSIDTFLFPPERKGAWRQQGWVGLKRRARRWQSVNAPKRYSGFTDFKGIVLNGAVAFLTALSGKQISKKLLMDGGIATPEAVQDPDEAVVIANYRARIDAAIPLLKSWLNTKSNPPPQDPILKMFGGLGSRFGASSNLGRLLDQRALIAEIMAEIPIDFNVINPRNLDVEKLKPPHTLAELRLAGIHAFVLLPDNDGTLSYEQAKEVERLLRMVRPYCEWDEKYWGAPPPPEYQPPRVRVPVAADESPDQTDGAGGESVQVEEDGRGDELEDEDEDEDDEMEDEDQQHFIDEMITVFGAVPPGGTART
ncbi:hypothetical protein K438DRAFT_1764811 [Mycena galopus ATCC 62051]|nr:hypothetical protein K438DRAFT_1764811 [Mycena galopus ATCC 62051]